jgi:hypothetical protein
VDEDKFSAPGLKILYFLTVGVADILQIVIESEKTFWLEITWSRNRECLGVEEQMWQVSSQRQRERPLYLNRIIDRCKEVNLERLPIQER